MHRNGPVAVGNRGQRQALMRGRVGVMGHSRHYPKLQHLQPGGG
jgi:hypothetical protein